MMLMTVKTYMAVESGGSIKNTHISIELTVFNCQKYKIYSLTICVSVQLVTKNHCVNFGDSTTIRDQGEVQAKSTLFL